MRVIAVALFVGTFLAGVGGARRLEAQTPPPTYVEFEPFGVKGALYRPDASREKILSYPLNQRHEPLA